MPKAEVVAPAKTRGPTKTRGTWRTDVVKILSAQQTGIAYPDLLAQVVNLRPDRPRSQGDKGFYHAIRRLILAEQIVKASNGLLYSAKLLKAMSDRGEALPTTRSVGRGGSASIVLGILNTAPDGLSGPALMERAAKHPDAPASLRTYRHYIYNILAKLRMNGAITKDGNTYRLASRGQAVH